MQEPKSQSYEKSMHGQMHDSLAFIIGMIATFFASPFIIAVTKDLVSSFAVSITEGVLDEFTVSFIWSVCVYGGVFCAVTYFIHIKITVMSANIITKQLKLEAAQPNQKEKSGAWAFIKGAIFMLLALMVIGSLTGCKEINEHNLKKLEVENKHKMEMAEGQGRFAKEEADANRSQEMTMKTMAIKATSEAQKAFNNLITGTISPLIGWIVGVASFCGLAGFGFFRFCNMCERLVKIYADLAVAKALIGEMSPKELQKAHRIHFNKSEILDLKAIK